MGKGLGQAEEQTVGHCQGCHLLCGALLLPGQHLKQLLPGDQLQLIQLRCL